MALAFNSYLFVFVFLPITVAGFWLLLPHAGRAYALVWLVLASLVFYAFNSFPSLMIVAPSILLDYGIARVLLHAQAAKERQRRIVFIFGIAANVALLCYFKYKNFFLEAANIAFATHFELSRLVLPLGLSFLVFQKIAFLADVSAGEVKSVRLLDYLLFTLFFPRTIAGPIVHYQEMVPQFGQTTPRSLITHVAVGICLFSIGLFKKNVIADHLGSFVAPVFDSPHDVGFMDQPHTLLVSWAGVLAYTFQLYFDFSGYSDMALGAARMLGVTLPMNFNSPFKAVNIVDFWNRWHISLTRFLTAYIYTPMVLRLSRLRMAAGKPVLRGKRSRPAAIAALVAFPTLVTMAISGIWHGAGWQFVVWGLLHGVYLTVNQTWRLFRPRFWSDSKSYDRFMSPFGTVLTFGCVAIALVFFRADSVSSGFAVLAGMVGVNGVLPVPVQVFLGSGAGLPWQVIAAYYPNLTIWWLLLLMATTSLLPNSLEILGRFHPALYFEPRVEPSTEAQTATRALDPLPWVGTIAALLCVIAIMSLDQSGGFLYGGF